MPPTCHAFHRRALPQIGLQGALQWPSPEAQAKAKHRGAFHRSHENVRAASPSRTAPDSPQHAPISKAFPGPDMAGWGPDGTDAQPGQHSPGVLSAMSPHSAPGTSPAHQHAHKGPLLEGPVQPGSHGPPPQLVAAITELSAEIRDLEPHHVLLQLGACKGPG